MGAVLAGAAILVVVLSLGYAFTRTNPATLARSLRTFGAVLLGLLALGLALTQRLGIALIVATASWTLYTQGRLWPGGWPQSFPTGARPRRNQSSAVQTAWLQLDLDHLTGEMNGRVLQGTHAQSRLSALDRTALLQVYGEAAADPETIRLLETYLDRRFGIAWRQTEETQSAAPKSRPHANTLSREEAWRVLGLEPGADETAIRAAHRKLMLQLHPDKGGSSYLAAKINEAKDVLLGT